MFELFVKLRDLFLEYQIQELARNKMAFIRKRITNICDSSNTLR